MVLRKQPFIEGATSVGLNGLEIAVRHLLPNVLPHILVITFLEMGAVLLLLGELGFVGIYIGGGSRIDLSEPFGPQRIFTIAEVPEWGAMIADGFRWLRSKPFIVFPPAAAFFVSVLGFNALGEGLRRLIEQRAFNTSLLLRKRMVLLIAGMTLATIFIMNNTGAAPWFARVARAFSGVGAYDHVVALTEMEGRGLGQPGGVAAATYIAEKFEEYGLEEGWRGPSYFYPLETTLVRPVTQPLLALLDDAGIPIQSYRHQLDFGYQIGENAGSGEAIAPLSFIGFSQQRLEWQDYIGLDLRGRIAVVLGENAPPGFVTEARLRGAAGILWIVGDGRDEVRSQMQLAGLDQPYLRQPTIPVFRLRPDVAQAMFSQDGVTIAGMFAPNHIPSQQTAAWFRHDLTARVQLSLQLEPPQTVTIPSVMAYIPGSDLDIGNELVVIFTSYDGLGIDPDGTIYPGANHNASGVGVMLELARLWQEQSLEARRTTLFVAWGGGSLDRSGAQQWIEDGFNFRHMRTQGTRSNILPSIVIDLDNIGAGGDQLLINPDSSPRLIALFEEAGQEIDLPLLLHSDTPEFGRDVISRHLPWIALKWSGPSLPPDQDTLESIQPQKLGQFGELFALVMTKLARESSY